MKELLKSVTAIQKELVAPKNQYNSFGKYKYRSQEDILEALKPLLSKYKCVLLISDTIENIADRYYVKATVKVIHETGESIETHAYAREVADKKGMDSSQITGSTSSYARKYALNGMFAIDDCADSDKTNTHDKKVEKITEAQGKAIFSITKILGMSPIDGSTMIKEMFGKESSQDLTKTEASEFISHLKSKQD